MMCHALLVLFATIMCSTQLLSTTPEVDTVEPIVTQKKVDPKTFSDRCNAFFKGLGYACLGAASTIAIYRYLKTDYDLLHFDPYYFVNNNPPPIPNYPPYLQAIKKADDEAVMKVFALGVHCFMNVAIIYLNYYLKTPQNAARNMKYAFSR